ncbi:MAG TPA: hypothetical protein VMT03_21595 [Polyangia bacterium]|nr:hypothetical protein [Polyangia bacterium]
MRSYVEAAERHDNVKRTVRLLEQIVPDARLHPRFVNTLARMEYVGVRKMLKSRRAERLDLDGIQHILDEAVHTLRLKKAAVALGSTAGEGVRTFASSDTLAGDAGESYLQALDHRAEEMLADLPAGIRAEANYLLTSAAVEVRAQVFYPLYDRALKERQAGFSVAAIMKDEDRHLDEMAAGLEAVLTEWKPRLEQLLAAEEALFARFLGAVEQAVAAAAAHG